MPLTSSTIEGQINTHHCSNKLSIFHSLWTDDGIWLDVRHERDTFQGITFGVVVIDVMLRWSEHTYTHFDKEQSVVQGKTDRQINRLNRRHKKTQSNRHNLENAKMIRLTCLVYNIYLYISTCFSKCMSVCDPFSDRPPTEQPTDQLTETLG